MKSLLTTTTLLLFITSIHSQSTTFKKLNAIYKSGKPVKLLKKATKAKEKDYKDAVPYYFLALSNYTLYRQSHINSNLSKAISNLVKAKKYDSDFTYWNKLEKEFIPLQNTIKHKTSYYTTNNKKKALKLCENYYKIYSDSLPEYANLINQRTQIHTQIFSKVITPLSLGSTKRDSIKAIADRCVGTPYKWAGESTSGFDCSGFVKYVYNYVGVKLPHNANKMSYLGKEVSEENAKTGDIILFGSKNEKGHHAYHAGIIYQNKDGEIQVIHSISKGVHITTDYNTYWKQRVLFITNVIDYPLNNEVSQAKTK